MLCFSTLPLKQKKQCLSKLDKLDKSCKNLFSIRRKRVFKMIFQHRFVKIREIFWKIEEKEMLNSL